MKAWKQTIYESQTFILAIYIGLAKSDFLNSLNSKFPSPAPPSQHHFRFPHLELQHFVTHLLVIYALTSLQLLQSVTICFSCSSGVIVGRRESEDKAGGLGCIGKTEVGRPLWPSGHAVTDMGGLMWFLNHQHHSRLFIGCP